MSTHTPDTPLGRYVFPDDPLRRTWQLIDCTALPRGHAPTLGDDPSHDDGPGDGEAVPASEAMDDFDEEAFAALLALEADLDAMWEGGEDGDEAVSSGESSESKDDLAEEWAAAVGESAAPDTAGGEGVFSQLVMRLRWLAELEEQDALDGFKLCLAQPWAWAMVYLMARAGSLQTVAAQGKIHLLRAMLQAGADVDARDRNGNTAIKAARLHGRIEAVWLLLVHGARDR
ncbi:MAG: ankyrin repeat domain-containing protein [Desulfovibrionaceae bacterium]